MPGRLRKAAVLILSEPSFILFLVPIYEYQCSECGCRFEELVSFSAADSPRSCPSCGAESKRLLSSFAIRVNGGRPSGGGKSCAGCTKSSCATC